MQHLEHPRGVLKGLGVQQTRQQKVTLFEEREFVIQVDALVRRQQPTGLQLHQGCGDQQKFGGHLQVEVIHPRQLDQVGIDDAGERDLVQVDLIGEDQVQQQVEGPLEHWCGHFVAHGTQVTPS